MERTQIYLSDDEGRVLAQIARKTGRTKSQLIREAIDRAYLDGPRDRDRTLAAIRAAAGSWKGRTETGARYTERVRAGRLAKKHAKPS